MRKYMDSTWQRAWHVVGTQRILVILNHHFVINFSTVIHLEVGISIGKECFPR